LGLGLAMVHRIVNDHRGSIHWGASELGGAAFHLRFALLKPRSSRAEKAMVD
jgi:C4-dicarboxylate-specific signal transduction histidine kinase